MNLRLFNLCSFILLIVWLTWVCSLQRTIDMCLQFVCISNFKKINPIQINLFRVLKSNNLDIFFGVNQNFPLLYHQIDRKIVVYFLVIIKLSRPKFYYNALHLSWHLQTINILLESIMNTAEAFTPTLEEERSRFSAFSKQEFETVSVDTELN